MNDGDLIYYYYKLEREFCRGDYRFREENVKKILEEIYQKGKDNKFKDIGYLDVDEFYHEEKGECP